MELMDNGLESSQSDFLCKFIFSNNKPINSSKDVINGVDIHLEDIGSKQLKNKYFENFKVAKFFIRGFK